MVYVSYNGFEVARSALRHKIGKAHLFAALARADVGSVNESGQLEWYAFDDRGIELHILGRPAAENPDVIIIYHVMPTNLRRMK
ncbi:MAG: hypothetical protein LBM94_05905 [Propionibacteriaceae bacterium]|jgi:hypothetical protein|nr:hypothetical protein [Propionibacteriaceae bacterium]